MEDLPAIRRGLFTGNVTELEVAANNFHRLILELTTASAGLGHQIDQGMGERSAAKFSRTPTSSYLPGERDIPHPQNRRRLSLDQGRNSQPGRVGARGVSVRGVGGNSG